jgi:tRNA(fMet)-specific endonuclease VapC
MKYLLDTNICVHYLRGVFEIDKKINGIGPANCYISEITLAELEFGVENSDPAFREKRRAGLEAFLTVFGKRIVPIRHCFAIYATQKAKLRQQGQMISDFDLLIASTAAVLNMIMVTENVREFERVEGIQIENWVVREK